MNSPQPPRSSLRILGLCASPRRSGNSAALLDAFTAGAVHAGHHVEVAFLDDHLMTFLRDCRQCRRADGSCSIDDGFATLFLGRYLATDAVAFATPIYWYGMAGILKTFLDRMFCYCAASYPGSADVIARMQRKRMALLLAAEETYPGAELGIVHQMQEFARYTHGALVSVVRGAGNRRGEVAHDPSDPLGTAYRAGVSFAERPSTDYRIDTLRDMNLWPGER